MKSDVNKETAHVADQIRAILERQVQAVLATQHEGLLYQHLMAYAMDEDLRTLYLASFNQTQKVENIRCTPNISLLWDNRTGNNTDHTDGFALSAQGIASIIDPSTRPDLVNRLRDRNDSLASLLSHDQSVLIVITIQAYHLAIGYSKSLFYQPAS